MPHARPGRSWTLSGATISAVESKVALQEQKYAEVKSSSVA